MSGTTREAATLADLIALTPRTRAASAGSAEVLNMGSAANLNLPFPLLIDRAEGARLFDLDGNEYIDTMMGFGTHVLGHRHPAVEAALHNQLGKGWMFGIHNAGQEVLARMLSEAAPCAERVIFCNSGTEATMYALRLARAATGRTAIASFDGGYHGAHNDGYVIADPTSPANAPQAVALGAGIPASTIAEHIKLPYRDDAALDIIDANRDRLAAVIIEGVQSSNPQLSPEVGAFLHALRERCRQHGIIFILDEVITGFRIAYGGVQEHYGITPDLATYGKALGGGIPIGAVAGRADLMELFQKLGRDKRGLFSGGSFSGNPLAMEAGIAHLRAIQARRPTLYTELSAKTARLRDSVNAHARTNNFPVQMLAAGSMFQLYFQTAPIRSARDITSAHRRAEGVFYLHLLRHGVLIPGTRRAFLADAHTPQDIDFIIAAIAQALDDTRADALI